MNVVHLHLLLNHVPVVGVVFVTLLLLLGVLRGSAEIARVSLALLALVGAASILVYLTGEPAQDAIEKLPGFSERLVDRHEDAALIATVAAGCVGALALGALVFYRGRVLPRWLSLLVLVAAVGASGLMAYTANLGGQIRHTEIRSGSAATANGNTSAGEHDTDER